MASKCGRGLICINTTNMVGILVIVLLVFYIVNKETYNKLYNRIIIAEAKAEAEAEYKPDVLVETEPELVHVNTDLERLQNPLSPPLMRNFYTDKTGIKTVPKNSLPINIPTRGDGGNFQQVGIIYKNDISDDNTKPGNNTDSAILPLFGKPTYDRSSQWNYYTSTDKQGQVKIPLTISGSNCTDDRGCKELSDGDNIDVPAYNGSFKVNIYKMDSPKYIPYL